MTCLSCHAETSNGLALCDLCRRVAATCFEFIPVHFTNLTRWRPGRAGSRPVPGSREPQGAFGARGGDRVGHLLDEVGNELTGYARRLADDRGVDIPAAGDEANSVRVACWLLNEHLTSVSTLDWAGEMVADLRTAERRLRVLAEDVVPGWYAGACRTCETSTYVVPGLTWVTCVGCGATTYARDHLEVVLAEARDWVARPKRIAEALVALLDTETSVPKLYDRIRYWASETPTKPRQVDPLYDSKREHVYDADLDAVVLKEVDTGFARYRLGQVLDLVLRDTRALNSAEQPQAS